MEMTEIIQKLSKENEKLKEERAELIKGLRVSKEIIEEQSDKIKELYGRLAIGEAFNKYDRRETNAI